MPDRKFIMDLAKLLIAAAWADGELQNEEINALKDLLFNLEDVSGDEWSQLEIYMDSPVSSEEREELLWTVLEKIQSEEDKELVVTTLEKLFQADGVVTEEEQAVLEEIKEGVSGVNIGLLERLSKMIKATVTERGETYKSAAQRESRVDDYIENTIYYKLKSESEKKGIKIELPGREVKKICLAAGLLARISAVDAEISDDEKKAIKQVLSEEWDLSEQQAEIVTQISCDRTLQGLDYFRLSRGFFECTTLDERRSFIKCLFKIANASNKTSYDETEEIRRISKSLKLTHKDFIEAKLTIPDEERQAL
ncbi:MAG TPA: TerB family tellurite resistance protein [Sedimentisphaerales bacterium]|nr:TerB family tellurite resistance protein [Sedimentisphaerales bacterium]